MNPIADAARNAADAFTAVVPSAWPAPNVMMMFGLLLALGVLGGMIAERVRWLPTITGFMAVGLLAGPSGFGLLSHESLTQARVLVDIALGLILFKLGATLHPVKLLRDRELLLSSLAESLATFVAILLLMLAVQPSPVVAVLAAAIAVSSSPAVLVHVAHELRAEGPVLEKTKARVASNNVLSFLLFTMALPLALLGRQADLATAVVLPLYRMIGAIVVAAVVARLITWLADRTREDEAHFRYALVFGAVILTAGLAKALQVSVLFTGLALGIACRWMQGRSKLTRVDFGGSGDAFFILLFVYAGANLHLHDVIEQAPLALAFVAIRMLAKLGAMYGCERGFGTASKPAAAGGLLLVPMAGLAIGLVQTTTQLAPELGPRVAAIVLASVAVFETIGPPIAAYALRLAGEAGAARDS